MGSHLSAILSSQKDKSIAITSRKSHPSSNNIRYIAGNAHDNAFLDELLTEKYDVIVDFMVYNTDEFRKRATKLLKSCTQYVFISSSRVYADTEMVITEDSPRLLDTCTDEEYLTTDEYALTKARQENILNTAGGGNWTIIRPYITFAENRLQLGALELSEWLYRALLGHTIVFSEDIAERYTTLTYGFDVARGIAAIIGNEDAYGRAFHITGPTAVKWRKILDLYLDIIEEETGKRPKVKMIERHPYIKYKSRKYQVIYDRWFNRRFDNSAIDKFTETSSFLSTEEGIRKSLTSFIRNNRSLDFTLIPSHEALYDRITGERMNLRNLRGIKSKALYLQQRFLPEMTPFLKTLVKPFH